MRCFIDTNVLISAGLFPGSVPAFAMEKALSPPNTAIVCDYSLDEMYRVMNKKFPHRIADLESFLYRILLTVECVTTPEISEDTETEIRDVKDRPILRSALAANADILITGDKDFLESAIGHPRIMTPSQFAQIM